jgi:hypothetical protein
MSGGFDHLGWGWVFRVDRILQTLVDDPHRLDLERKRYNISPPCTYSEAGTTTDYQTPDTPPGGWDRYCRLEMERRSSRPFQQFRNQIRDDETDCSIEVACEERKKRWVEQGIWNDRWNGPNKWGWKTEELVSGWKHEEPELETETEETTLQRSDEEKLRAAERRATRKREREASRPFHQFVYQVSKERERIQVETATTSADINARAYETVNKTWMDQGIWNRKWGILPGMSWKHEAPLEEIVNDLTDGNGSDNEAGQVPSAGDFGSPHPIEADHQVSNPMNTSQQGQSADTRKVELGTENAEHSPPAPPPTTPPSKRNPFPHKDEQPKPPTTSPSLHPIHPPEPATKKRRISPHHRTHPKSHPLDQTHLHPATNALNPAS